MAREPAAELRQRVPEPRAQEQRAGADGACRDHDRVGADPVVAGLPLRLRSLGALGPRPHPDRGGALREAQHLGARHDLHARGLGPGELDLVRALLRAVRTSQVAQARAPAAARVDGELVGLEAGVPTSLDEQPVVVVDQVVGIEVDPVLGHVAGGAPHQVLVIETGHGPVPHHSARRRQGGPRIDHGRAPVGLAEGQRHRAVRGQEASRVGVERVRHLELAAGALLVREPGPLLDHEDPPPGLGERPEPLRHRAAPGAAADDEDVGAELTHRRPSAEAARAPPARAPPPRPDRSRGRRGRRAPPTHRPTPGTPARRRPRSGRNSP